MRAASQRPPGPGARVVLKSVQYQLVSLLGCGGMAEVWLAHRLSAEGVVRPVAMKCITPDLAADKRVRRMLIAEAQLAGRLNHPNIVSAYALERVGNRYYLVLEYVEGLSALRLLEAAQRAGSCLSEGFCCHVVASIADALAYAHGMKDGDRSLGIIHRDVKASNAMIGTNGVVKLLDFGVAYSRMEGRVHTQAGTIRGTCAYFSPEQARGEEVLDGRSDLFSLGVLLVELLTGKRPFTDEHDTLMMRRIEDCDASEVEAATAGVAPGLREICRRALAKSPSDRFQDGEEFAGALRDYLVRRGIRFGASECASELRGLPSVGVAEADEEGSIAFGRTAEVGGERGPRAIARVARVAIATLALAGGWFLGVRAVQEHRRSGEVASPPPISASGDQMGRGVETRGPEKPSAPDAGSVAERRPDLFTNVVRPKRARSKPKVGAPRGERPESVKPSKEPASFAGEMGAVREAPPLARGTLIQAKLPRSIDAAAVGVVEAVVTEDVVQAGDVRVPSGSSMVCNSMRSSDGRVGLWCERIKTSNGVVSLSGVAVGEGSHAGLRMVDNMVPAGTSFVVYVTGH